MISMKEKRDNSEDQRERPVQANGFQKWDLL